METEMASLGPAIVPPGSLREEVNEGTGKGWLAWWGGSRPQGGPDRVGHNPSL